MYNDYNVKIMTTQKVKELRQEADLSRLLHQGAAGKPARLRFFRQFLSRIFRKPERQPNQPREGKRSTGALASSRWAGR